MSNPNPIKLSGLARRLVEDGLIDLKAAQEAEAQAQQHHVPLIAHLVETVGLNAQSLAQSAAAEFGMPLLDLAAFQADSIPEDLINEKFVKQSNALPLSKRNNKLYVAIADPMNLPALDEIKFSTGLNTEPVLVEQDKLTKLIEEILKEEDTSMQDVSLDDDLDNLDLESTEETADDDVSATDIDDTPVVRFANKILLDAINRKASDIHIEPYEKEFRVRYRVDGILSEVAKPPQSLAPRLTARFKVMSNMDISERRVPQDGRIKLKITKDRAIDFRVNTCPTLFGEKIVLRILDPSSAYLGIDMLGYEAEQKNAYLKALANPYGLILVTGPTGSGKTVSLYTGLGILNTPETNISTAEDPAEINMPGVNQVNVNVKVGLTFAEALRAFLRQDPDVIMVGEIRDLETAEIAIKAAQTGHLVLSTLHTNDAPQTLTRLMNMGVPPFNIATSISLIIAQRLGRRLCKNCKKPVEIPRETLLQEGFKEEELDDLKLMGPIGCDVCGGSGYKGRVGIYQVLTISDEMSRMIMAGANSIELADQANKEGINDLRASGLNKVREGVTSLEEINRVTKD